MKILPTFQSFVFAIVVFQRYVIQYTFACLTGFRRKRFTNKLPYFFKHVVALD